MIYVREPTAAEQDELTRMTRQEIGRVSQRAQMVLLSARGQKVPDIARIFEVRKATVRFWLRRFDKYSCGGLYDQGRSGRPPKMTKDAQENLVELLQDDPQHSGYLATFWTVAMLALALLKCVGIPISQSTVRQSMQRLGLRWRRPRLSMPDKVDPQKARKQWEIAKAIIEAPEEAVVLYEDESRLQLLPLLRAMWQWAGKQLRVPTPGNNVTRTLFGALNPFSGDWTYLVRTAARKDDFLAFLEHLLALYPGVPMILIVDNFSSHTAHAVADWLTLHPRLQLFYLPLYCSHLNPVEAIWLRLKNKIAANRLYASMPFLLKTVDQFFQDMTPALALQWVGA